MNADRNPTAKKPAEPADPPDQESATRQAADEPAKQPAAEKGKKRAADKKSKKPAQKKADAEAEGMRDRMLRLQADFENFRRRTQREREELYRMANEDILAEILPVLDHFELAIQAGQGNENSAALLEGVRLVWDQLNASLAKFHLKPIETAGVEFDPNLHEALSQIPSNEVAENHILMQHRRGYLLGEKLLRPAQVVVSAGPGPDADAAETSDTKPEKE